MGLALEEQETSTETTANFGRWAGALLVVVLTTILVKQFGAQVIAGDKLSGTDDATKVVAYYHHAALRPVLWQAGLGLVAGVMFFSLFRAFMRRPSSDGVVRVALDVIVVLGAIEMGLLAVETALQLALVDLARHAGGDHSAVLALFHAWDWLYNSLTLWFEAAWALLIGYVIVRSGALPRGLGQLGIVAGVALALRTLQLVGGLPTNAGLPAILLFIAFTIGLAASLLRANSA